MVFEFLEYFFVILYVRVLHHLGVITIRERFEEFCEFYSFYERQRLITKNEFFSQFLFQRSVVFVTLFFLSQAVVCEFDAHFDAKERDAQPSASRNSATIREGFTTSRHIRILE
jgi:hypothetical protein